MNDQNNAERGNGDLHKIISTRPNNSIGWKRIFRALIILSVILIIYFFFAVFKFGMSICDCWIYIFIATGLVGLIGYKIFNYDLEAYNNSLVDPDIVKSQISEANAAILKNNDSSEVTSAEVESLRKELDELEQIGKDDWVEYRVLLCLKC